MGGWKSLLYLSLWVYVRKVPLWYRSVDDRDKKVNAPHWLAPSDLGEHLPCIGSCVTRLLCLSIRWPAMSWVQLLK